MHCKSFEPLHRRPLTESPVPFLCRINAFNSQVVAALGGPSVVDVFAVIGRSSSSSSSAIAPDCAALRTSVSAVRVCLELDPPVSDTDDVAAPFTSSLHSPPSIPHSCDPPPPFAVARLPSQPVPSLRSPRLLHARHTRQRLEDPPRAAVRSAAGVLSVAKGRYCCKYGVQGGDV